MEKRLTTKRRNDELRELKTERGRKPYIRYDVDC